MKNSHTESLTARLHMTVGMPGPTGLGGAGQSMMRYKIAHFPLFAFLPPPLPLPLLVGCSLNHRRPY